MRIVFFGSSDFSVPFLESVKNDTVLIVTSPDRKKGRGKKLLPNPVKEKAIEIGIPFITAEKLGEEEAQKIKSVSPELFVVVSYGVIIPESVLNIANCAINVHPSKVPYYRGASPIIRQIMDGVKESAVSIIKVSKRLDRGDIILQRPFEISETDTRADVEEKVIRIGTALLKEAIEKVQAKGCTGAPQEGKGTYAKKITKEDEKIDWRRPALKIYNKVRALYPSPCAYALFRGKRVKVRKALLFEGNSNGVPGEIVSISKNEVFVQCGAGALKLLELQMEGKKPVSARDFINGVKPKAGERFE